MFNSNLANWFFSDERKLYTKQKGCHGVGERVGQDLELYTCISKKDLSPQHRKRISDSWQCVPPRRPRRFGADSEDKLPSGVLVHLSLPRTQVRLNFANHNQTFGASFCVKLRQVDPILLLLCILCGK